MEGEVKCTEMEMRATKKDRDCGKQKMNKTEQERQAICENQKVLLEF